jgi:alpha-1,3-rhamnosyl/mannosyltransferase
MSSPIARPTIRAAVNLLWCVPGGVGGSEHYLVRQLAGLGLAGAPVELTLFATAAFREAHAADLPGCSFVDAPHDGARRPVRIVDESTWLHRRTRGFDLVHHGGGTAPRRARRPYVLTIHDLQHRTFPHYVSRVKRWYLDAVVPGSARRAAAVAVPSEYVRTSVVRELRVHPSHVSVVPHGYEPTLLTDATPEHELRSRHGLGASRVIVYPAMTAPHKRHDFLVELMRRHWTDSRLALVLIGGRGAAEDELTRAVASSPAEVGRRIFRLGRVSDADRNGLLAMAEALVFPSEYEGFGAPVIEAMALGTPVVCSDATCLPDVAGDAALVLPLRLDAWASALDEVAARRDELVRAGRARARHFTAVASAEALLTAYRAAIGSPVAP